MQPLRRLRTRAWRSLRTGRAVARVGAVHRRHHQLRQWHRHAQASGSAKSCQRRRRLIRPGHRQPDRDARSAMLPTAQGGGRRWPRRRLVRRAGRRRDHARPIRSQSRHDGNPGGSGHSTDDRARITAHRPIAVGRDVRTPAPHRWRTYHPRRCWSGWCPTTPSARHAQTHRWKRVWFAWTAGPSPPERRGRQWRPWHGPLMATSYSLRTSRTTSTRPIRRQRSAAASANAATVAAA